MSPKKFNIGVVGATGMVGKSFMETLQDKKFPVGELRPFASDASIGKMISFANQQIAVKKLEAGCFKGLELVFFSSGDDVSKEWAPKAVADGAWAVDNSAAFRMNEAHHLVVPEVNIDLVENENKPQVIANPNCSTIQLVVVLKPLLEKFGLSEVRVASYQAASGAGQAAYDELLAQTSNYTQNPNPKPQNFVHQIAFNCIPQIGSFGDNGFTTEESKIMNETRKILRQPKLRVSAFAVRVPVLNAHAEAVWVTLNKKVSREEVVAALSAAEGIVVQDQSKDSVYPMQKDVSGKDPVYVGRIHQDLNDENTWLMWVVSDNIRKGAALNGIQIAEKVLKV